MEIKYLGHSSFLIKGRQASVVTDPFDSKMLGLKFPKVKANIVTVSHQHQDHNKVDLVGGNPLVIDLPGEYEKDKIRVTGLSVYHDAKKGEKRGRNTLFKIEIEDVSILHCGDLGHKLSNDTLEKVGNVDILIVPVGGEYTIDDKGAAEVVNAIEPSVVIPMHYKTSKLEKNKTFEKLLPVSNFLEEMGASDAEALKKFKVKREEFEEEMKIVVLEA